MQLSHPAPVGRQLSLKLLTSSARGDLHGDVLVSATALVAPVSHLSGHLIDIKAGAGAAADHPYIAAMAW